MQGMKNSIMNFWIIISLLCGLFCAPVVENNDRITKEATNYGSVICSQESPCVQIVFVEESLLSVSNLALLRGVSERRTETTRARIANVAQMQIYLIVFVCFLTILFSQKITIGSHHFIIQFIHNKDGQKA